ncbi:MAG: arsenosugar biosynthesis radical SAM (seleno)protein ArsS [Thermodesulfobacteriota bacterium]
MGFSLKADPSGLTLFPPFSETLLHCGLTLDRENVTTLQVNIGLKCNQICTHCHLAAGPHRQEMMDRDTMGDVVQAATRIPFQSIDITGGAPELHPDLPFFLEALSGLSSRIILRSNLSAQLNCTESLLDTLIRYRVVITSSFPSLNAGQTEAMRGKGAFQNSIEMLKILNEKGYGKEDGGLELNLVVNPAGAFLPSSPQGEISTRFHRILQQKWGVTFNGLYSFANVPLGRYREWLIASGNIESYMSKLVSSFNPCAVEGLMCRSLISVSWDGYLFDCDFNQAAGLYLNQSKIHISEVRQPPGPGTPIAVGDHCYTCTAGSGFS